MPEFSVYIPVRDSGKWIGQFLDAYRALGVEPLYVVDSRTTDDTIDVLRAKGARFSLFEPTADFAEAGMIEYGAKLAATSWVLRLDADELPSRRLIDGCKLLCDDSRYDSWWLQRREICPYNGEFVFATWQTRVGVLQGEDGDSFPGSNSQLRLFNKDKVKYTNKVHTPGIIVDAESGWASKELFFAHFQTVLLSAEERLVKVRNYAKYDSYAAWVNADEYFFELLQDSAYLYSKDSLEEFLPILQRVPLPAKKDIKLSLEEHEILLKHVAWALGDALAGSRKHFEESYRFFEKNSREFERNYNYFASSFQHFESERIRFEQDRHVIAGVVDNTIFVFFMKKYAETMLTLGRIFKNKALTERGEEMYNFYTWSRSFKAAANSGRDVRPD